MRLITNKATSSKKIQRQTRIKKNGVPALRAEGPGFITGSTWFLSQDLPGVVSLAPRAIPKQLPDKKLHKHKPKQLMGKRDI